ncbi:hypothetical protein [Candidatus Nanohalobium constans]|uniref:Transmembrane protein n=1 Tax=Candidatus Nanohalobium constans TaxID=2565781 RepID=A0A5Q0UGA2_9ARCH|nr:hypothetical protein [Candidatus Nanohalobium constans]QGA80637.1 hypothetical protein LC1Nh_0751 [Candidatus Nanohalobium constans]
MPKLSNWLREYSLIFKLLIVLALTMSCEWLFFNLEGLNTIKTIGLVLIPILGGITIFYLLNKHKFNEKIELGTIVLLLLIFGFSSYTLASGAHQNEFNKFEIAVNAPEGGLNEVWVFPEYGLNSMTGEAQFDSRKNQTLNISVEGDGCYLKDKSRSINLTISSSSDESIKFRCSNFKSHISIATAEEGKVADVIKYLKLKSTGLFFSRNDVSSPDTSLDVDQFTSYSELTAMEDSSWRLNLFLEPENRLLKVFSLIYRSLTLGLGVALVERGLKFVEK